MRYENEWLIKPAVNSLVCVPAPYGRRRGWSSCGRLCVVGLGVGLRVGLGLGVDVGGGEGLGVGLRVGLGLGFGVGGGEGLFVDYKMRLD